MKPTKYMDFVCNEVNQRFGNPQYPKGEKLTRIVWLGNEPIQPNSDGSIPPCLHNGFFIGKIGLSHLAIVRWGVIARGNVPSEVKGLDELAVNPQGKIEYYLSATNHVNNKRIIAYHQEFETTSLSGHRDYIETRIKSILNSI